MVFLVVGSVVSALSTTLIPLIVGRSLQGLAAGVIPIGISVMRDVLPAAKVPGAVAILSASMGVGAALGLPVAIVIAEYTNWHSLFCMSAGLGIVSLALIVIYVPESDVRTGGSFDIVGAVGLSAALISLLLPISKGGGWGWTSPTTLMLLALSAVTFVVWALWELRSEQPLVNLRVVVRRQVLFTNLASVAFGFAMFAQALVIPQVLQLSPESGFGLGQSMLVTGLVIAPSGLVMMFFAPVSSRITTSMGPRITLMVGAVTVAVGYGFGIFVMISIWQVAMISMIIAAGIGIAYGGMPALIMASVPTSETAAANSFNTLMRSLGTSFASAVAGVILAQMTTTAGSDVVPSEGAFRLTMAVATGAAVLALVLAGFLPHRSPADRCAAEGNALGFDFDPVTGLRGS